MLQLCWLNYILQIFHVALRLKSWCEYLLLWAGCSHPHRFRQLLPPFKNATLDISLHLVLCCAATKCLVVAFFSSSSLFFLLCLYTAPCIPPMGNQVLTLCLYRTSMLLHCSQYVAPNRLSIMFQSEHTHHSLPIYSPCNTQSECLQLPTTIQRWQWTYSLMFSLL